MAKGRFLDSAQFLSSQNLPPKMHLDPLQDCISRIELIDSMGNDLSVVNDARASFDRSSSELNEKELKLINYLIKFRHFSPLRGVVFKFKVKAPIYICRQWVKHIVASAHVDEQLQHNEKSFRYVDILDSPEYYIPKFFSTQSSSNKQGSGKPLPNEDNNRAIAIYKEACEYSFDSYKALLDLGVSREQARGVLNPAFYTSWVWTTSLQSVLNFIQLRKGKGAQSEIARYAECIERLIQPRVPETIKAWEANP
jgi:thymidylate synthase (FAD)